MIRRPPRSTQSRSSAASDVYKRPRRCSTSTTRARTASGGPTPTVTGSASKPVSYTHLRAHETRHDLVCRLLLEKKKRHPVRRPRCPDSRDLRPDVCHELLFFNAAPTTESYTEEIVGSVRCV